MKSAFYEEWTATVFEGEDGWYVEVSNKQDFQVLQAQTRHMCPFDSKDEAVEWASEQAETVIARD